MATSILQSCEIEMVRVSFQGERGAYSEAAAKAFFGGEIEAVPHGTFADALKDTEDGITDHTILPVENSIEGSVGESYDLLYTTQLAVTGEAYHRIEHCLIGSGGLDTVKTVYSHPQALGQCRGFLEEHGMKTIPTYDTAGSVRIVKELGRPDCASIASRAAAAIFGMPVISEGIADNQSNYTRFLVLSKDGSGGGKTSIIFSIKHEPGSLYRIIAKFHEDSVNLTKIESRPTKQSAWEYNFYVDFEGDATDPKVATMLDGIKQDTITMKVLGSYPPAKLG